MMTDTEINCEYQEDALYRVLDVRAKIEFEARYRKVPYIDFRGKPTLCFRRCWELICDDGSKTLRDRLEIRALEKLDA